MPWGGLLKRAAALRDARDNADKFLTVAKKDSRSSPATLPPPPTPLTPLTPVKLLTCTRKAFGYLKRFAVSMVAIMHLLGYQKVITWIKVMVRHTIQIFVYRLTCCLINI